MKTLTERLPRIDVLIDDGGHTMGQQINTYEELFPYIEENGLYLCEDTHTSYRPNYGGGYKKRNTFVEYSKDFIDYINAWHSTQKDKLAVTEFTKSVHSLHYYDSVLVVEKRPMEKPSLIKTGLRQIPDFYPQKSLMNRIIGRLQRELSRLSNLF